MKRHLGERLSALIDGELSDTQRERVLAHLAGCEDCRREAAALRLLKRRMHTLGDAAAGDALTWRLLALRPAGGAGQSARRAARAHRPGARRRRHAWSLAAAGVATAGLGLTGAVFLAGGGLLIAGAIRGRRTGKATGPSTGNEGRSHAER